MNETAVKPKRDLTIDVMNILACLAVIALHHNGLVHSYDKTRAWKEALVAECVCYFCVPVFMMITGATLLNYRSKYNTKKYFKKRLIRGVFPWLIWSLIFLVWKLRTGQIKLTSENAFKEVLDLLVNNKIESVYWFYKELFAVYLAIPVFSLIVHNKKALWYAFGLNFFFMSILPLFRTFVRFSYGMDVPIVGSMMLFVLLGYLLKQAKFTRRQRLLIYIVGFGCMIFRYIYTYHFSILRGSTDTTIKGYNMFHSVFYTLAIWVMAHQIDWEKIIPDFIKRNLPAISSCSLGIYLIHRFVMHYEQDLLHINNHSLFWRTGFILITYLICLALVWLMKKIPVLRRIVP